MYFNIDANHHGDGRAQANYLQNLRALAVLCHEVLAHSTVAALPEALHRAASMLHDHALLVRYVCMLPLSVRVCICANAMPSRPC